MKKVYLLQHCYEDEVCEGIIIKERKIIGIYDSYANAEKVKEEFKFKEGFEDFPEDCFVIDGYEIDQDNWVDGFI